MTKVWHAAYILPTRLQRATLLRDDRLDISGKPCSEQVRPGRDFLAFQPLDGGNRNATQPANAILNYPYTVLESQVRVAAGAEGLDPCIGYLHTRRPGRVALVYDLMEPLRPRVDALVLDSLRSHNFSPSDFTLDRRGVCRLHPRLARNITQLEADSAPVAVVIRAVKDGLLADL